MNPVGMEISSVVSMNSGRMSGSMPESNKWCCQTKNDRIATPNMPAAATLYPKRGFRVNTGMISDTMPKPGSARMYTSGWPKNQNTSSYRYDDPPSWFTKNAVCAVRSVMIMYMPATSTGAASTSRNEVVSIAQTNIGTRPQRMPGAR